MKVRTSIDFVIIIYKLLVLFDLVVFCERGFLLDVHLAFFFERIVLQVGVQLKSFAIVLHCVVFVAIAVTLADVEVVLHHGRMMELGVVVGSSWHLFVEELLGRVLARRLLLPMSVLLASELAALNQPMTLLHSAWLFVVELSLLLPLRLHSAGGHCGLNRVGVRSVPWD